MSTKASLTNKTLNLVQLKDEMDEIIFNYIDTTQKWEVAYSLLDELLKSAVDYFNRYVKAYGELPKENTYWVLFLDIVSKIIYFHTIAYYQLNVKQQQDVKEQTIQLLTTAANCIPDVNKEVNAEFLNEIASSYDKIQASIGEQGAFEKMIINQKNRASDCIKEFEKFSELLIK